MIIDFFIYIFYNIISGILSLFPTGFLDSRVSTAIHNLMINISKINAWINLDTLFTVINLIIATEIIILTFRTSVFIYNRIRGSG